MAFKKCPKCELNYIREDEQYCNVCLREMRRVASKAKRDEDEEEVLICTECGEAPAVRGSELCAECLKEQKRQVELENAADLAGEFDGELADGADEDGESEE